MGERWYHLPRRSSGEQFWRQRRVRGARAPPEGATHRSLGVERLASPATKAGCPIQAVLWLEWDTTALEPPIPRYCRCCKPSAPCELPTALEVLTLTSD